MTRATAASHRCLVLRPPFLSPSLSCKHARTACMCALPSFRGIRSPWRISGMQRTRHSARRHSAWPTPWRTAPRGYRRERPAGRNPFAWGRALHRRAAWGVAVWPAGWGRAAACEAPAGLCVWCIPCIRGALGPFHGPFHGPFCSGRSLREARKPRVCVRAW